MNPAASVVVPTRNRVNELGDMIESVVSQTVPVELLICDDASEDAEEVRKVVSQFPEVRLLRTETARGPTYQRNRGIEAASCEIVFAPDDDTIFVSKHTVEQTLREFAHPRVAAVGIPYANMRVSKEVLQRAPDDSTAWAIHAFVGAAHAVRRSMFLAVGGYREHFFYMGEEGDLCLRLLARGWITRVGAADTVHHLESPSRAMPRAEFHARQNDILNAWHNTPAAWLLPHLLMTTVLGVRQSMVTRSWFHLRGIGSGYAECVKRWCERGPVSTLVYRVHRKLKKSGPLRYEKISSVLSRL